MALRNNRREFLKNTTAAGVGFWIAGQTDVWSKPIGPNDRLNIAIIGAGGRGEANLNEVARTENIVALCDADSRRARSAFNNHRNARKYDDYRRMFDRERNNIDAVVVSTPDHNHALASILAMRLGKHVYCEKPLTHSVWEARQMKLEAARHRVATQMGNQGTSGNNFRQAVEIIQSGALGPVREVHVWTNRPIWPQGIRQRPAAQQVPEGLTWESWLGPAPRRDYNEAYVPFAWRGWWDFGTGAIGDMACHTMNLPFMALRLEAPSAVVANVPGGVNNETAPVGCTVTYEFPARGDMPALTLRWYERGLPPRELFQGQEAPGSGSLIVGQRGTMLTRDDYGNNNLMLPVERFRDYRPPEARLPRSPGHHREWLAACKGGRAAMSNFVDYASKLTETALLGNVAMRVGQRFTWNSERLEASNRDAAQYIRREYRQGWTI